MSAAAAADFYAVLGVGKDCSDSELRNAYKKLALRWHPDRCSGKDEAKEKFQAIQEAYSVLSDPDKRLMYDIGVYNENDDDENAGMGDFLDELAEMMSKNTPSESGPESFEELQRLFVEMFQSDIDAEFGGGAGAGNGWNRGSNKRGSSEMNKGNAEFGEMDMGTGGFCYGSNNPVGESSSKVGGNSSSSSSSKRRNGRKQKVSSSKNHVSSCETYDNTLVH